MKPSASADTTLIGSVAVVQESVDPVTAPSAPNAGGELDARLTPGQSWSINAAAVITDSAFAEFYINGRASCYQSGSFRS
jgi:hypothetical protein